MKDTAQSWLARIGHHQLVLAYLALALNIIGLIVVILIIDTWSMEGLFLIALILVALVGPVYGLYLLYNWLKPNRFFLLNSTLLFAATVSFLFWFVGKYLLIGFPLALPLVTAICFILSSIFLFLIGVILQQTEGTSKCPVCKKELGKWAEENRCRWCGAEIQSENE